ncbi:MAG: hypothetical protein EOM59_21285 [Clostridia bacterium]|nr:hypothetical protein [Clostridia bacterium]
MSNNNLTQTIDLQPFFTTLERCGFKETCKDNELFKQHYLFNYELSLYHHIVKVNLLMLHTNNDIIVEIDIAGKIGAVDSMKFNNASMLSRKDIFRLVGDKVTKLMTETQDSIRGELYQLSNAR